MKEKEKLISLKEAAKISGYTPNYIGYLIRKGKIRGEKIYVNSSWQIRPKELIEYLRAKRDAEPQKKPLLRSLLKKKLISLKEAAKISGYTPDYIGYLIRKGKIKGRRVFSGITWLTTEESLREYKGAKIKNSKRGSRYLIYDIKPRIKERVTLTRDKMFEWVNALRLVLRTSKYVTLVSIFGIIILGGLTIKAFVSQEQISSINIYPTNWDGDWENPSGALKPEVENLGRVDAFFQPNSAVYKKGASFLLVSNFNTTQADLEREQNTEQENIEEGTAEQGTPQEKGNSSRENETPTRENETPTSSDNEENTNQNNEINTETGNNGNEEATQEQENKTEVAPEENPLNQEEPVLKEEGEPILEQQENQKQQQQENQNNETETQPTTFLYRIKNFFINKIAKAQEILPFEKLIKNDFVSARIKLSLAIKEENSGLELQVPPETESTGGESAKPEETPGEPPAMPEENIPENTPEQENQETQKEIPEQEKPIEDIDENKESGFQRRWEMIKDFIILKLKIFVRAEEENNVTGSDPVTFPLPQEETEEQSSETQDEQIEKLEEQLQEKNQEKTAEPTEATDLTEPVEPSENILPVLDTKIIIWYSLDGETWWELGIVSNYPLSNELNGGYFTYEAPFLTSWEDVKNLQIKFEGVVGGENKIAVFLDSVWLEVGYQEKGEEFELKPLKEDWRADEEPQFQVIKRGNRVINEVVDAISGIVFEEEPRIAASLVPPDSTEQPLVENEDFIAETHSPTKVTILKQNGFRPGIYKLKVDFESNGKTYDLEQDFSWGVLAINVNKSIYLPQEISYIQMAVLNESGHTICDASLKLEITSPDSQITILSTQESTIQYSGECGANNVTSKPDYFAYFQVRGPGKYKMILTNLGNNRKIDDYFEVRESVPFDIERIGPTRIYPASTYEMTLKVRTNQDFRGRLIEDVPTGFDVWPTTLDFDFEISASETKKNIVWNIDWKNGESHELRYRFDAPDISPYLYLLGPLRMEGQVINNDKPETQRGIRGKIIGLFRNNESQSQTEDFAENSSLQTGFEETRRWQIASDAPGAKGFAAWQLSSQASTPRITNWSGTVWGTYGNAQNVTNTIQWIVVKANPQRDEIIIGTLGSANDVKVQICAYDKTCNSVKTMTDGASNSATRVFDIAIERGSGNVLVVYDENVNQQVSYDVWDGLSWAGEATLTIGTAGTKNSYWIDIFEPYDSTSPNPDNMMLCVETAVTSTYPDLDCVPWTGSNNSFGTVQDISTGLAAVTSQGFYGAWEDATAGNFIIFFSSTTSGVLQYYTYVDTTWTLGTGFNAGEAGFNYRAAVYPDTDRVMVCWMDTGNDLNCQEWSGTAMGTGVQIDPTCEPLLHPTRANDVAPVLGTNGFLAMYGDSGIDYFDFPQCTSQANCQAGTWSILNPDQTDLGTDTRWGQLYADPDGGGHLIWWGTDQTASNGWYKGRITCNESGCTANEAANSVGGTSSLGYEGAMFDFIGYSTVLKQNHYRWYDNTDFTDVTDPWPPGGIDLDEDTPITASDSPPAPGNILRLRISINVSSGALAGTSNAFKLQYAEMGGPNCTGNEEVWYDVGSPGSGLIWRGYDNTPADGTTLSSHKLFDSDRDESYEENNPSALNPNAVLVGEDGEWDWVIQNNDAAGTYCFRIVKSNGKPLNDYNYYPRLSTAPAVNETHFRWRNDDGREDGQLGVDWNTKTSGVIWGGRSDVFGGRYDLAGVVFQNKMWTMGGYGKNGSDNVERVRNDVWYSNNGVQWIKATSAANWERRGGLTAVVFNNNMWIMGGYNGTTRKNDVWYSSDGVVWTQATAGAGWVARDDHTSVVFNNAIWVIGGNDGTNKKNDVWYSTNGTLWTQATAAAGWTARYGHSSVVFNNAMWVIGGYDGNYKNDVWYSTEGSIWTQATATSTGLRGFHASEVFDNEMWVMGGFTGLYFQRDVWYSTDGTVWTQATSNPGWEERTDFISLNFNNKLWVTGGQYASLLLTARNDVWYSSNGANWIRADEKQIWSERKEYSAVSFDNKLWIIGGIGLTAKSDIWYSSSDGSDWFLADGNSPVARRQQSSVVFNNAIWVIGGYDGSSRKNDVWYSTNGTLWTQATAAAGWTARNEHSSVVFNNAIWVIGGYDSSGRKNDVWYSTNGTLWTQATAAAGWTARYEHSSVVFNNAIWVIGGYDGNYKNDVWYSTNGTLWTQATAAAQWLGRTEHVVLELNNKMWILGGSASGTTGDCINDVWFSTDGANWVQVPMSARNLFSSLDFNDKMWVIGGWDGWRGLNDVWYSTDGAVWTLSTASSDWAARHSHSSVVFGGAMWVIGGYDKNSTYKNDVWYSTDGAVWTQATASAGWQARLSHTSVVFDSAMWVIGGWDGSIHRNDVWYSTNGTLWTQATANAGWVGRDRHASVVFNGAIWVMGGYDSGGGRKNDVWYSTNGILWTQATAVAGWTARHGHSSVVFDNKIWLMGGNDGGANIVYKDDVWYSTEGTLWTQATANADWTAREGHSSLLFDNKIWVIRGWIYDNAQVRDVWYSEKGATWKEAQDAIVTNQAKGQNIRLRFSIENTGGDTPSNSYRLQVAQKTADTCDLQNTGWSDVPTTTSGCGEAVACMKTSDYFPDGNPTTSQLTIPDYLVWTAGKMVEDPSNQSAGFVLYKKYFTELEYNFQLTSYAGDNTTYCFQVTNANTYSKRATVTTAAPSTVTISGTCKQYNQIDDCDNSETIKVAVNGSLQGQSGTTLDGLWSISGVTPPNPGDVITVFIDGVGDSKEAVGVTKYDGSGTTISGINLYERHLSIGSDDNQTITNENLKQYDNSASGGNEDIFHDVDDVSNDLTACAITGCSDVEIYIKANNTYRPDSTSSGNVSTHDIEIDGIFTADGNTVSVSGSWDNNYIFNADTSTIIFTATSGTETINSAGATTHAFNNLTLGQSSGIATWNLGSSLDVNGALLIDYGTLAMNGANNINLAGDLTINSNGNYSSGSGIFTFDGSGTNNWKDYRETKANLGTVSIIGSSKNINLGSSVKATSVTIGSDGTLGLGSSGYTLTITGSGQGSSRPFIVTPGGILNEDTDSSVEFTGASATDIEAETYHDLRVNQAGTTFYAYESTVVSGVFTIQAGTFNGSSYVLTLSGTGTPFVINGTFNSAASTVSYTGNGVTNVTSTTYYTLSIGISNNADINYSAAGAIICNRNLTVESAGVGYTNTFSLGTYNLTVGSGSVTDSGGIDVKTRAALSQSGGTTVIKSSSGGSATIGGAGTITFYSLSFLPDVVIAPAFTLGSAGSQTINVSGNLTIGNGANSVTVTALNNTPTLNIDGNVNITANGTFVASNTGNFYIGGNWSNSTSGIFTHSSGTVTFDGAGDKTISDGGDNFYNITFNGSGTWLYQDGANGINQTKVQNGTVTYLNTKRGNSVVFEGGTLYIDWYLGVKVVETANPSNPIDTGETDITIEEKSSPQANAIWKWSGGAWSGPSYSQTTGTNINGVIPSPGTNGAIRIREYERTIGQTVYYKYNIRVAWQTSYGAYDYFDDYGGKYIASTGSGAGDVDSCIDDDWKREGPPNYAQNTPEQAVNDPPTNGTWYLGMLSGLIFQIRSPSVNLGELNIANDFTSTSGSTTLTVTTSASRGYVVTAWATNNGRLKLETDAIYIDKWTGTNPSPSSWDGNCPDDTECGFGYNTNDGNLGGSGPTNRFVDAGSCGADFQCWAGFADSGSGDPVADRTGPSNSQSDIVTYKVSTSATKEVGKYETIVVYICTANY